MLHSEETENMALLYSYGELPAEQEEAFLEHLRQCPKCQAILFGAGVVRAAMPVLESPMLPQSFYAQPERKTSFFSLHGFSIKHLVPAAVLGVLLLGGVSVYKLQVSRKAEIYNNSASGMYSQLSDVESEVGSIENYCDSL
jgi:hypothetical protein